MEQPRTLSSVQANVNRGTKKVREPKPTLKTVNTGNDHKKAAKAMGSSTNTIQNAFSIKTNNRLFGNIDMGDFRGLDDIQVGRNNNAHNEVTNNTEEIDIKIDKTVLTDKRNAFNKKFLGEIHKNKNTKEENLEKEGNLLEEKNLNKKKDLMELEEDYSSKNTPRKSGKNTVDSKDPVFENSKILDSGMKKRILNRNGDNLMDMEEEEDLEIQITFPNNNDFKGATDNITSSTIENTLKFKEWATQKTFYDKREMLKRSKPETNDKVLKDMTRDHFKKIYTNKAMERRSQDVDMELIKDRFKKRS